MERDFDNNIYDPQHPRQILAARGATADRAQRHDFVAKKRSDQPQRQPPCQGFFDKGLRLV